MKKLAKPKIVIHGIDQEKVAEQITKAIDNHLRLRDQHLAYWDGHPDYETHTSATQPICDRAVYDELTYYVHAFVQQENTRKFRLKYDRTDPGGTGPFTSRKKAEDWFLNGGR